MQMIFFIKANPKPLKDSIENVFYHSLQYFSPDFRWSLQVTTRSPYHSLRVAQWWQKSFRVALPFEGRSPSSPTRSPRQAGSRARLQGNGAAGISLASRLPSHPSSTGWAVRLFLFAEDSSDAVASSHRNLPCSAVPSCPLEQGHTARQRGVGTPLGRVLSHPRPPAPWRLPWGPSEPAPGSRRTAVPVLSLPRRPLSSITSWDSSTPSKIWASSQHLWTGPYNVRLPGGL